MVLVKDIIKEGFIKFEDKMIEDIIVKQKEYMFIKDINTGEYILI